MYVATIAILGAVILFLLAYIAWQHESRRRELDMVIAGMLSQNPHEYANAVGNQGLASRVRTLEDQLKADRQAREHRDQKAL